MALFTTYQITELMFGTVFFPFFYFLFLYFNGEGVIYWDIIWCTITFFIINLVRFFVLNYNLLQSQNLVYNII